MSEHWRKALAEIWDIEANLTALDGEHDLNFWAEGKERHVLKVMRPECDESFIEMQCTAIEHLLKASPDLPLPPVVPTSAGENYAIVADENGESRIVWLLGALPGKPYAKVRPHSIDLIQQVGRVLGRMDAGLKHFNAHGLDREFKWNLLQGGWIRDDLNVISNDERKAILTSILAEFDETAPMLRDLPKQAIHNDANDYNLLVSASLQCPPQLTGLVDFGDMCRAPKICNLAVAAAYLVLEHHDPEGVLQALVSGYHSENPLAPNELQLLWPLLRMRLAVSVVNSTLSAVENPNDPYVTISQAPAWRFLEANKVNADLLSARLRVACGMPVTETADELHSFLTARRGSFAPVLGRDLSGLPVRSLAVEDCAIPQDPFRISDEEAAGLCDGGTIWCLGRYREPRMIYTDAAFRRGRWKSSNRRTVHLAIDIFAPAGTPVHTPLEGEVAYVDTRTGHLDYGGMVVLRHRAGAATFYTLYGHLDPSSFAELTPDALVAAGEAFATLGAAEVNGGWAPHLHFQLALDTAGMGMDWPGVADPDDLTLWETLCPNPAALLNLPDEIAACSPTKTEDIAKSRRENFSHNLKLSYSDPIMLVRGWKHHLFDQWGRPYLDAYNNVPHVGHAHPRIRAVAEDQLSRLNTNTRYLHRAQTDFAEKILSKLPDSLSVCFFVNSGTEANELALRLARAASGGKDMITPDHGYHGNTTGAIDISAYKFNAPRGVGQPDWVQLVEVADDYRGSFRRDNPDRATRFADLVDSFLARIADKNRQVAGFIAETYPSVGGQIIPPQGYLPKVYEKIRAAGGICIADEVQTGLGRLGKHYFAFEEQGAIPDIVVLGKPIGNGHPLGVVVTTREIADAFAEGPEFFSTFGGSTLSCRIGREVLQIVDDEGLAENAQIQGAALLVGLREIQVNTPAIGDVRGTGLFIGIDFVEDRITRTPATVAANYAKGRLRQKRILVGTEGPADNVLKIRPPLTIDEEGVACFLDGFSDVMREINTF